MKNIYYLDYPTIMKTQNKEIIPKIDNLVLLQVFLFVFGFIVPICWGIQLVMLYAAQHYVTDMGRIWVKAGALLYTMRVLCIILNCIILYRTRYNQ